MNVAVRSKKGLGDLFNAENRLRMGWWKRPKRRLRAFRQLGVEESWAKRFAYSRMGGWAIACSPIMGTAVTEERLRQRVYIPFLEYYLKVKYGSSTKARKKK